MSRSFKHVPISKCGHKCNKPFKMMANRKVRRTKLKLKRKNYRKLFETWDIYDYTDRHTLDDARHMWESSSRFREKFGTFENYINRHYKKYYYRK